jgi:DNA-binding MarR family transcriptional regulator
MIAFIKAARDLDISVTLAVYLIVLSSLVSPTITVFAENCMITTAAATRLVDCLVHRGFVERTPTDDRRKWLLQITEAGSVAVSTLLLATD